jgi:hypothetical protein
MIAVEKNQFFVDQGSLDFKCLPVFVTFTHQTATGF